MLDRVGANNPMSKTILITGAGSGFGEAASVGLDRMIEFVPADTGQFRKSTRLKL